MNHSTTQTLTQEAPVPLKLQHWATSKLLRERGHELDERKRLEICQSLAMLTLQIAAGRVH